MTAHRLALVIGLALSVTGQSSADDSLVRNHAGVPLLVVVRRATAIYERPDKAGRNRPVGQFAFFYALKPEDPLTEKTKNGFYSVASGPGRGHELGWIHSDDLIEWPHPQALGLRPRAGRQRALFFKTGEDLRTAHGTGTPPTPLSREPKRSTTDANLLPILERFTMTADGREVDGYHVAYLHARPGRRDVPQPETPSIDFRKATLDVTFVVDTSRGMEPWLEALRQGGAAVAAKLPRRPEVRFALVGYRQAVRSSDPDAYVTRMFCDLVRGSDRAAFGEILDRVGEAKSAGRKAVADAFGGLKLAIQQAHWNPDAFKHVVLIGRLPPQKARPEKSEAERLTAEDVVALAQPRGRENVREKITIHAVVCHDGTPDEKARKHFQELARLGEYPGLYGEFKAAELAGFIEELVGKCHAGLSAALDRDRDLTAVGKDSRGLGLVLQMVRPGPAVRGDVPSFATGFCCAGDTDGNEVFEAYVLVQHERLSLFNAFLRFSIDALRNAGDSGSRDVKKVVLSVQILATQMNLGEPVEAETPLSKLVPLILGVPVRSKIFDMTFAKLAAMSDADFQSWVRQVETSRAIIQSHLDNTGIWRSLGPDVPLEQRHCFLRAKDLP